MAVVIKDRVKQISLTTGSGAIALSGSFGGFTTFSAIGNSNQTFYGIENESRYEVGVGTYNSGTLTRDTVLSSSNGGSKINLDGVSTVFCTYPAGHSVYTNTSGFLDLSDNSGIILPGSASFNNLTVSGDITVQPYADKMTTFIRTSSGNFFQAYVDDSYDRTVALYTDATSSPQWRLGVKNNPTFMNQPPTYAYVYGEDGDVGIVADATCDISLKHSTGYCLTHKGVNLFEASKVTGVSIAAPYAGATLVLEGSGYMSRLGTVDVQFGDGTIQTTAFLGLEPVSGIAVYASGQVDLVAADLLVVSGIANAHTTDYSVDVLANTASGTAISGWALSTINAQDHSAASVSGWANSTFITTDSDTTYTGGSGITLQGGVFHASNSFAADILAVQASGSAGDTAVSGWVVAQGYATSAGNFGADILANSASGTAISGWASSTFVTSDTDTTYTGGSGITLQGGVFHATNTFASNILANTASGTAGDAAVSGWVVAQGYLTSDSDTTYAAGSGMSLQNGVFHFVDSGSFLANSASGVAISGWATNTFVTTDTNTTYTGGSGLSLVGTTFHWTESGVPIANSGYFQTVIDALPAAVNYTPQILANSASGVAISGWATNTFITTDTDTTYTAGSGMTLQNGVFHFTDSGKILANSASGVAISGWAAATFITSDSDTTYQAGSGLELVGNVFHNTSGVAISGWAAATFITTDTDTTYTAGSGMTLQNGVFHFTNSGEILANSASGVAISGWASSTFVTSDTNTTYTAGSGMELVGTTLHVSAVGGSGHLEGLTVDKAIKTIIETEPDGATITFNMNDSNTHMATLGGNRTIAVENAASGQKFMMRLKQDGTGSRTVTWFSDIAWENGAAPTLSSVAGHADWFGFVCTSGGYYDGAIIMSGVR